MHGGRALLSGSGGKSYTHQYRTHRYRCGADGTKHAVPASVGGGMGQQKQGALLYGASATTPPSSRHSSSSFWCPAIAASMVASAPSSKHPALALAAAHACTQHRLWSTALHLPMWVISCAVRSTWVWQDASAGLPRPPAAAMQAGSDTESRGSFGRRCSGLPLHHYTCSGPPGHALFVLSRKP